jgi:hypothetical protein
MIRQQYESDLIFQLMCNSVLNIRFMGAGVEVPSGERTNAPASIAWDKTGWINSCFEGW